MFECKFKVSSQSKQSEHLYGYLEEGGHDDTHVVATIGAL